MNVAELIPAEYRKEILELNMVTKARVDLSDPSFAYLLNIWKVYVEPDFTVTCGQCLMTLMNNYKSLLPKLIELEKNYKMLDAI